MLFRKYLLLGILGFSLFLAGVVPQAFGAYPKSAIQESFNVNKFLKTENQGQRYFQDAEDITEATGQEVSPVAAFAVDVVNFLVMVIGSVSLLIFIAGALLTVVSEGEEARLQKGKDAMLYSIIGLILAFAAYLIATFVQSIFF